MHSTIELPKKNILAIIDPDTNQVVTMNNPVSPPAGPKPPSVIPFKQPAKALAIITDPAKQPMLQNNQALAAEAAVAPAETVEVSSVKDVQQKGLKAVPTASDADASASAKPYANVVKEKKKRLLKPKIPDVATAVADTSVIIACKKALYSNNASAKGAKDVNSEGSEPSPPLQQAVNIYKQFAKQNGLLPVPRGTRSVQTHSGQLLLIEEIKFRPRRTLRANHL